MIRLATGGNLELKVALREFVDASAVPYVIHPSAAVVALLKSSPTRIVGGPVICQVQHPRADWSQGIVIIAVHSEVTKNWIPSAAVYLEIDILIDGDHDKWIDSPKLQIVRGTHL